MLLIYTCLAAIVAVLGLIVFTPMDDKTLAIVSCIICLACVAWLSR